MPKLFSNDNMIYIHAKGYGEVEAAFRALGKMANFGTYNKEDKLKEVWFAVNGPNLIYFTPSKNKPASGKVIEFSSIKDNLRAKNET